MVEGPGQEGWSDRAVSAGGKEAELGLTGHSKAERPEVLAGATGNRDWGKRQGRQAPTRGAPC